MLTVLLGYHEAVKTYKGDDVKYFPEAHIHPNEFKDVLKDLISGSEKVIATQSLEFIDYLLCCDVDVEFVRCVINNHQLYITRLTKERVDKLRFVNNADIR